MEYQYPISLDWSTEEIIDVVKFFESIERAYEKGIERDNLMAVYRRFKEIVPSKAEEKTICNDFDDQSKYTSYRTIQKAKDASSRDIIKM